MPFGSEYGERYIREPAVIDGVQKNIIMDEHALVAGLDNGQIVGSLQLIMDVVRYIYIMGTQGVEGDGRGVRWCSGANQWLDLYYQ